MKPLLLITGLLAFISLPSHEVYAGCTSVGTYTTCSDGNSYIKVGKSTYGSNSRTGSNWSQHQSGNYTFGTDSNGNSWSHYQR